MKFHSLRRSLVAGVFAFITAALVAACGGGSSGAAQSTQGGPLAILPGSGTVYAGVPTTFTVVGGRAPYTLSSSDPSVLPVPQLLDGNSFTIAAANPADPSTGAITSRAVTVTVRESLTGASVAGTYTVQQNFLTGFGLAFNVIACTTAITSTTPTTGLSVPNGCEIALTFNAAFGGARYGNRPYKIEVLRGPVTLVDKVTGLQGNTLNVTSDHEGKVIAIIKTTENVPTQLAVIRITDVATGVFSDTVFTVNGGTTTATLATVPSAVTFTGPDTDTCGSGSVDVFVFGGLPPYAATSTFPNNIFVTPIDPNNNPGVFRVRASGCITNGTVIFTDRFGSRTTFTVTTERGTKPPPAPPTPPVSVTPNTITLACGGSGSVTLTGGATAATYSASSPTSNVAPVIAGRTLTVTRTATGTIPAASGTVTGANTVVQVNVTDGATIATLSVTSPTTCP